jgi:hypothetical protein
MTVPPVFLAVTLLAVSAHDAIQSPESKRAAATFVFLGTVAASTSTETPTKDGRTVLVSVDQIYFQKGTFENQTGRQVEVLGATVPLNEKGRYVFYTDPVRFGERVAVSIVDVSAATDSNLGQSEAQMKQQTTDQALRREIEERAALAELVISGAVSEIRPSPSKPGRDTEHDPDFRVARVKVERPLKGKPAGAEIEFLFANSKDVQWFRAPKFRVGDRGVFFLQRPTGGVAPLAVSRVQFTVLDPLDFRPARDLPTVEAVLRTAPK